MSNTHHFRLAPEVLGRSGAVAVAALALLPLTALARSRRWAAFALGGTLVVLVLMEVPWLFVHFSDAVSLSQSRRAAGFAPLPFVFAGALARRGAHLARPAGRPRRRDRPAAPLARRLRLRPAARRACGGHVDRALRRRARTRRGVAAPAGRAAAAVRPRRRRRCALHAAGADPRPRALEPARAVRPAGALAPARAQPAHEGAEGRDRDRSGAGELPRRRRRAGLRRRVAGRRTSPTHARTTRTARRTAVLRWVRTNDPSIPRRYGATWAIRAGRLYRLSR